MQNAPSQNWNRVLTGLIPNDQALLRPHLERVFVGPGEVLQHQDRALDYVYFPHEGFVSLVAANRTGESVEIASIGCEAALCALSQSGVQSAFGTAIAQSPLRASRIELSKFEAVAAQSETLMAMTAACADNILMQVRQAAVCSSLHPVEGRLARWLLHAGDRMETGTIPVTQVTVAKLMGVRRTTVTLVAGKLQDIGAICWHRSRVEILDPSRLRPLACECYATVSHQTARLLSAGREPRPIVSPAIPA